MTFFLHLKLFRGSEPVIHTRTPNLIELMRLLIQTMSKYVLQYQNCGKKKNLLLFNTSHSTQLLGDTSLLD